jgi:hypothetical protein
VFFIGSDWFFIVFIGFVRLRTGFSFGNANTEANGLFQSHGHALFFNK